jgi:hypothetical protein
MYAMPWRYYVGLYLVHTIAYFGIICLMYMTQDIWDIFISEHLQDDNRDGVQVRFKLSLIVPRRSLVICELVVPVIQASRRAE